MENILYAYVIGSLMYAQTFLRPNISFAIGMSGKYQSNIGLIGSLKSCKESLKMLARDTETNA